MIKKIIKDIPEKTKVQIEQKNINEIKKIINGNEELKIKLKTIPKVLKKKIYKFNLIDFFEIIDSETYSKLLSLFDMEYINNILKGEIHIQEEKIFLYTNHNDIFFNAFGHIDKGNFYPEYLLNLQDSYFNTREYFKKTGWKNIKKNKDIKYKNYSFICYDYVQLQKPNKLDNKLKAILLLSLYQMKIQQILQRNNDNAIYEEVKLLNIDILNEYHYNKVYGNLENNNDYNNLIKEYLKNIELHDINLDSLDQFMGLFMNDKKLIEINNQIKKKTKKNPIPKNQIITLIDKKIKFYENFIFVGKEFYEKYIKNNLCISYKPNELTNELISIFQINPHIILKFKILEKKQFTIFHCFFNNKIDISLILDYYEEKSVDNEFELIKKIGIVPFIRRKLVFYDKIFYYPLYDNKTLELQGICYINNKLAKNNYQKIDDQERDYLETFNDLKNQKIVNMLGFIAFFLQIQYKINCHSALKQRKGYLIKKKVYDDMEIDFQNLEKICNLKEGGDIFEYNYEDRIIFISKSMSRENYEKYSKNAEKIVKINKSYTSEPEYTGIYISESNQILIFNEFKLIDKRFIYDGNNNYLVNYCIKDGLIIINTTNYLNKNTVSENKFISYIGKLDKDKNFDLYYLILYKSDDEMERHLNIISNELTMFLNNLMYNNNICVLPADKKNNFGVIIIYQKKAIENSYSDNLNQTENSKINFKSNDYNFDIILQIFFQIKELVNFFIYNPRIQDLDNKSLSSQYKKLIDEYKKTNENHLSAQSFYDMINAFRNNNSSGCPIKNPLQLMSYIICQLHKELNENDENQKEDFIISRLFFGNSITKVKCSFCNEMIKIEQKYFFISFNLVDVLKYKQNSLNNIDDKIDIYNCFSYYYSLMKEEKMYCKNCKKETFMTICNELITGPKYLIIILHSEINQNFNWSFNEELNLNNYIQFKGMKASYNLFGIISYSSSMKQFVAYFKDNNNWNRFDKKDVTNNLDLLKNEKLYILIYKY